ncbi:MAG: hypothetical protein Q7S40_34420 [Opitutaceae bacterium]|nr:hypothetical protein [Opitutaceae bacterium]
MSPIVYYILHLGALFVLTGYTFYAFAAPPETRKRVMMITGIASLLAAVGGFGLQAKMNYGFPVWMIVKIVCWLGLSALAGMAYRKRDKAGLLMTITIVLLLVALVMVYHTRLSA